VNCLATKTPIKPPKFELSSHPDFRVVHINAFFGGLNPIEGRITFYTDIIVPKMKESENVGDMEIDKIRRESQIEIRMAPMDFITLAGWMNGHIKRLEDLGLLKKEDLTRSKQQNFPVV
jgi:hypothetical protein